MRLGLIARADNTGLGVQSWEAYRHLTPDKTLVVDVCHLSPKGLDLHLDRFPEAYVSHGFPADQELRQFLTDLDVVLTFETAYNNYLYALAAEAGVATVLVLNYEFLDHLQLPDLPRPTLFVAPSRWHYGDIPFENKVHLPWPVDTDRFPPRPHHKVARRFRHVVGWPAIYDRAGTPEVFDALSLVTQVPITVTVSCQDPAYVQGLARRLPANITLHIDARETPNYWEVLGDDEVLLAPRRYGGLSLPTNEALAAGMPVIMTDMEPNNLWLPADWLVTQHFVAEFMTRAPIRVHGADPTDLARLIERLATDAKFYGRAVQQAHRLARSISWDTLHDDWVALLEKAVAMLSDNPVEQVK